MTYWLKELRYGQRQIPGELRHYLRYHEAPQWCFDALQYFAAFSLDVQLAIEVAVILYLLFIQFYFFRYLVCDGCFSEYKQLTDDVNESAKTLD